MNNKSEVVFILDKSGSMYDMVDDSIGGYNRMIDSLKSENIPINVTTILFNSNMEYYTKRVDIMDVLPMEKKNYEVGGLTALYDAIGHAIRDLSSAIDANTNVSFFITTDGEENDSDYFNLEMVQVMIDFHQKYENWKFHFLAKGVSLTRQGIDLGIDEEDCKNYEVEDEDDLDMFNMMEDMLFKDLE